MTTTLSDNGLQFANTNILNITGAQPTTGTFSAGDIVLESTTNNRISGWKRQTTGSGNVTNVDWFYFAISPTNYTAATTPLPAAGVSFSANHGLGVVPAFAELELTCLTAEFGYSVGDVIIATGQWNGTNGAQATSWKNATQVGWVMFTGFNINILNKSTGANATPTAANWSYRFNVRAY